MSGKLVRGRLYAHWSLLEHLEPSVAEPVMAAVELSGLSPLRDFNVVRLDADRGEVALLAYPSFCEDLFPALQRSWLVSLARRTVTERDYASSSNPPILHRKELLVPHDAQERTAWAQQSTLAESLGLFSDPVRIGFRSQWEELLQAAGYGVRGNELLPLGNAVDADPSRMPGDAPDQTIARHLTALSRRFLSAPVQLLLRLGIIREPRTVFDYGCGRGDDLAGLQALGFSVAGWDPYYRPDGVKVEADVVNLGFVINVIEDMEERIEALASADRLAGGALCVSAMLQSSANARARPYKDGVITQRNTFQKYYTQMELQRFIQAVLEDPATPLGPGIFVVFKDERVEHEYLRSRQTDSSRAPRLVSRRSVRSTAPSTLTARAGRGLNPELEAKRTNMLDALWVRALDLGRSPEPEEVHHLHEIEQAFGSLRRALAAMRSEKDNRLLEAAADARRDEIRVTFALEGFSRRSRFRALSPGLQTDVRTLFGSLGAAQLEGRRLLQECGDAERVDAACRSAARHGLGWYVPGESLQVHTSLVCRLPALLRTYVGCATTLYGDPKSADLVKIHASSGKLTLLKYDDFEGLPLPRLTERIKLRLRDQDLDYFTYGGPFPEPYLYFKSRYINEEFPRFAEQMAFDAELERRGLPESDAYGPSPQELSKWLRTRRLEVQDFRLVPASTIPSLDEACGRHLTYRQLIEAGDTWQRLRVDNAPKQAQTYNALLTLADQVLDPVIEYFGSVRITYGHASPVLTKHIARGIAPRVDQHAGYELNRKGAAICSRLGAAVDFLVTDESMTEVANWVADNCRFDRMYFYGDRRPLHVSVGPEESRQVFEMRSHEGRTVPRRVSRVAARSGEK